MTNSSTEAQTKCDRNQEEERQLILAGRAGRVGGLHGKLPGENNA